MLASAGLAYAEDPRAKLGARYSAPLEVGRDLIGKTPVDWTVRDWINSKRLKLQTLRGKVVLVRWWTAPGCPYCAASAEALIDWSKRYRERGLVVIGMYHHKSNAPLTREHVEGEARKLGFTFPIAIDHGWQTLERWWLNGHNHGWTSVTFLLDRQGVIQHVHPGGAYFEGEPGYAALQAAVEAALAKQ